MENHNRKLSQLREDSLGASRRSNSTVSGGSKALGGQNLQSIIIKDIRKRSSSESEEERENSPKGNEKENVKPMQTENFAI